MPSGLNGILGQCGVGPPRGPAQPAGRIGAQPEALARAYHAWRHNAPITRMAGQPARMMAALPIRSSMCVVAVALRVASVARMKRSAIRDSRAQQGGPGFRFASSGLRHWGVDGQIDRDRVKVGQGRFGENDLHPRPNLAKAASTSLSVAKRPSSAARRPRSIPASSAAVGSYSPPWKPASISSASSARGSCRSAGHSSTRSSTSRSILVFIRVV